MKPLHRILTEQPKAILLCIFFILSSYFSFAQPSNNECNNATTLTSSTSCVNAQYRMRNATASAGIPVGCASGGTHYDVWFQFTAASTTHTVTISNLQNNFTNPEIQLFSGTCGSLTSLVCGTLTMTGTGLTIGNTYYIRVSNVGSQITNNQDRFDICVTHPPPPPANDDCAGATLLTSGATCVNTTGNLYYATSNGPAGGCPVTATASNTYEVWYRFQAVNATQAVTVSNLGARLTAASTYMQVLSGTCGAMVSLACQSVSTTNGRITLSGLTVGTFYYVRVYVLLSPTASPSSDWNFSICVQNPPANDECAGAVVLTSGASCVNTAGSLDLATLNAATPLGCFAAGNYYDVWYRFTAMAVTHTVSLSSLGSSFTAPRIQIYSGGCGALISVGCAAATSLTQGGLTIGNVYYVRIANFNTNPSGAGTVANFNICVTAAAAPPSNDLCTGAITLTSGSSCSNISGTLMNATSQALAGCGNNGSADVWYSFVAQTSYPVITLSSVGASFSGAGPRIQLYSGTCAGLTSIACGTTLSLNTAVSPGGAGLTVGNTYYVRITTNTSTGTINAGTWTFNICVTNPTGATIDYAKSYINVTDGTVGGTIDPGDILEIRATLVVARTGGLLRSIDSVAFYDTVNTAAGVNYISNTIAMRTNEGKLYIAHTDAFDSPDAGWVTTSGADRYIQINMGSGSSNSARGKLRNTSRPSNFGNTCIILATYRVAVTGAYGSKINFGGGAFTFRDTVTGVYTVISFPKDSIMIFQSPGTCQNNVSSSNILGDESNGTFGTALPQSRGTSPNTNYSYLPMGPNQPNDYYYSIANNTSGNGSTNQTLGKPSGVPNTRVFNLWDITGDHTGAANTARGNLPCNTAGPISGTNPCGYMLVINAAYQTDTAFQFNVTGACPNTYYEISAWYKNICYKCGCDSMGRSSTTAGYIPTAPGDSSGVRPNIAIEINGVDYYTTGDLVYQGLGGTQTGSDTLNNWVQRAFVYRTGTNETSFNITFRNNAPGGGGNDWTLDDIALKTCTPNMSYSPTITPTVCENNTITIYDTVRCFYNTYVEYKWQRSTDGGVTWTDVGSAGTGTPVWNGSQWEYVAAYTIPASATTAANDGDMYRLVVATTSANLSSASCNFTDPLTISLDILTNCGPPLKTDLLSISGKLNEDIATVYWTTSKEEEPVRFILERSPNAQNFTTVTEMDGYNNLNAETNNYNYTDPVPVTGKVYYRVQMITASGYKKYSRVILLSPGNKDFSLGTVVNPFVSELQFEVISPVNGMAKIELIDQFGKTIKLETRRVYAGVNAYSLQNTYRMPAGVYILKVSMNDKFAVRRVLKENN